jgi:hypothetical protein
MNTVICFAKSTFQKRSSRGGRWTGVIMVLFLTALFKAKGQQPNPHRYEMANLDSTFVYTWTALHLKLIRTSYGWSPPVASRALGYVGVTLYESVVPGMKGYASLAGQLNGLKAVPKTQPGKPYHWGVSANAALAYITRNLWGNASLANRFTIDSLEAVVEGQIKSDPYLNPQMVVRSRQFGLAVAKAVFAWSITDGGHEGFYRNVPTNYVSVEGRGLWVPTSSNLTTGRTLQPFWGKNRLFLATNAQISIPPPLPYSEEPDSPFYKQTMEVYKHSSTVTEAQQRQAIFWSDGTGTFTPPGHSWNIATIALKKTYARLDRIAFVYAQLGIALADAFICAWKCKFTHNSVRPETFVHNFIDPLWRPLLDTPPFPEHISGHATQAGAMAGVLTNIFGTPFLFMDNTYIDFVWSSVPSFNSFEEAALECANSRFHGGIHFQKANEDGLKAGRQVAANVKALKFY